MSHEPASSVFNRRAFLRAATVAGVSVVGFPAGLTAQGPSVKVGVIHPVTGPLAEPGQACRLGAQMAADAINAGGGIKSLRGAKIELIVGDTQTKPDVGRTEAERVINQGAQHRGEAERGGARGRPGGLQEGAAMHTWLASVAHGDLPLDQRVRTCPGAAGR